MIALNWKTETLSEVPPWYFDCLERTESTENMFKTHGRVIWQKQRKNRMCLRKKKNIENWNRAEEFSEIFQILLQGSQRDRLFHCEEVNVTRLPVGIKLCSSHVINLHILLPASFPSLQEQFLFLGIAALSKITGRADGINFYGLYKAAWVPSREKEQATHFGSRQR